MHRHTTPGKSTKIDETVKNEPIELCPIFIQMLIHEELARTTRGGTNGGGPLKYDFNNTKIIAKCVIK